RVELFLGHLEGIEPFGRHGKTPCEMMMICRFASEENPRSTDRKLYPKRAQIARALSGENGAGDGVAD
ncbi:MAG: hypothetical protein ACXWH4_12580, partial [Candidatus Aminicenantales bacterium]